MEERWTRSKRVLGGRVNGEGLGEKAVVRGEEEWGKEGSGKG